MSAHSCNDLCDLDDKFHDIQKYEGESEVWSASRDEMKAFLLNRISELLELIKKLDK